MDILLNTKKVVIAIETAIETRDDGFYVPEKDLIFGNHLHLTKVEVEDATGAILQKTCYENGKFVENPDYVEPEPPEVWEQPEEGTEANPS